MPVSKLPYWIRHEKRIHQTFSQHVSLYRQVVDEQPQAKLPKDFERRIHENITAFAPALPLHAGGPGAFFNKLMPVLGMLASVHTVLRRDGWTVDQIGRLTYEVFKRRFDAVPALARRITRKLMVSPLFPRMMSRGTRKMVKSGRSDTFFLDYSHKKTPKPTTTMVCTQCGMIQFMKAVGMDEMYSYCNIFDFAQADSYGLGLTQPSCIGRGDGDCVYNFTSDPSDTVYPRTVKRILGTELEN